MSTLSIQSYFDKHEVSILIQNIATQNGNVQTVMTNSPMNHDSILVCFIHGAPGSGMDFKKYMVDPNLRSKARLMTLDRPGYGHSDHNLQNITLQAEDIMTVINASSKYKHLILGGHSYGCAISGLIAIENPELVSKIIFLASVIDPFNEKVFWYAKLFNSPMLNWLLPNGFQAANYEKNNHKEHLLDLHKQWNKLQVPIHMIHGKKDSYLAPYNNVVYAKQYIPTDYLDLQVESEMGHLIPFMNVAFTTSIVEHSINRLILNK